MVGPSWAWTLEVAYGALALVAACLALRLGLADAGRIELEMRGG